MKKRTAIRILLMLLLISEAFGLWWHRYQEVAQENAECEDTDVFFIDGYMYKHLTPEEAEQEIKRLGIK